MSLRREEGGWALVTAILLMTIMAGFGLATMAMVDNQQKASADGRRRETAFNIAEAALNAQTYQLARTWPGQGGATNTALRYPTTCTQTSTDTRCPTPATLLSLYASPDTTPNAVWTTAVRDNSGSTGAETFWSEGMLTSAPSYDANGDGRLWVRSQSTAVGKTRRLVALVRTEPQQEDLPHVAVTAGRFEISNNGNKMVVDAQGPSAFSAPVHVRCIPYVGESTACYGHQLGTGSLTTLDKLNVLLDAQLIPNESDTGYTGGAAMTATQLARLKLTAQANGTYYTTCPTTLTGTLVYIETTLECAYTSTVVYNSADAPGAVVMPYGSLIIGGGSVYYGLIYHANVTNQTGRLVSVAGTAKIQGGTIVDGDGTLYAGSSGVNFVFDDRAFTNVKTYGGAGLVQNTWREIR